MSVSDGKWAAWTSYGPVLSQVELHMLKRKLEINPVLANTHGSFRLVFNMVTGRVTRLSHDSRDSEHSFDARGEPATLPRVEQLLIITPLSPWCTTVNNSKGVTVGDVCAHLWRDYTDQLVTEAEFNSLPPQIQEDVKQVATRNPSVDGMYHSVPVTNQVRRVDWLRECVFFEALRKDDDYTVSRFGFKSPNVFVMDLLN
ncbi:hypothetical protein BDZ94DRAFT_476162 [Collybia nuda]|uniref:DUF6699 domain-containing protein n=1 Tax=Collybia nuda TaxID=64659 RepID=A0A9P5YA06_9AGAR|nr:hypothetical protein BDZ94DRAFT_476162 [Collybia nuda]